MQERSLPSGTSGAAGARRPVAPEPWIRVLRADEVGEARAETGAHAIFAAQVPFLPSFLSEDFVGPAAAGASRVQRILDRQVRFINDLARVRTHSVTFDLRLLFRPHEVGHPLSTLTILFLGKVHVRSTEGEAARVHALDLWRRFHAHFPSEDPFNYPLVPVDEAWLRARDAEAGRPSRECAEAFDEHVLVPIPLERIGVDQLREIRKFEDADDIVARSLGVPAGSEHDASPRLGYLVHHFRPTQDPSGWSQLLEALMQQDQTCLVRISLQPTRLTDVEVRLLNRLLSEYEQQHAETRGWICSYKADHLARMQQASRELIRQRHHLFTVSIQVVGAERCPSDVVSALGSELMSNPSGWPPQRVQEVRPRHQGDDLERARTNLFTLSHLAWGLRRSAHGLERVPRLVSGHEAVGAFRLPIPPESGYMPGVPVRDEPFVKPQGTPSATGPSLGLGRIIHRGRATPDAFHLSLRDLRRHLLIAGSTGSGKTVTCLHLLSQLWREHRIPFLVIYPIAKPDYRVWMADPDLRDDLLVFTAGDRASPLRFNPFDIPAGVLVRTHVSNLMRSFETGMWMWPTLRMLFREALRQLYVAHGFHMDQARGDDAGQRIPTLEDFYTTLREIAGSWSGSYNAEVRGDLRQDSEKKILDLLETAGSVLNVPSDGRSLLEDILERPTVIELGRVGSAPDIALVIGFLVTGLGELVFARQRARGRDSGDLLHVTAIEEAHRVMPSQVATQGRYAVDARVGGAEDFAHILSEVRGYGEGIVIAEQTPTKLISDAVGNTHLKVMHWLEDEGSFELFSRLLNLNERQRRHARTLDVGEVLVRTDTGYPVLVQVPHYAQQLRERLAEQGERLEEIPTDDAAVQRFMERRLDALGIRVPHERSWRRPGTSPASPAPTIAPAVPAPVPVERPPRPSRPAETDQLRRLQARRHRARVNDSTPGQETPAHEGSE